MPSNAEYGKHFILSQLKLLGLLIAVYVISHLLASDRLGSNTSYDCGVNMNCNGDVGWQYFADITPQGAVTPKHFEEMDWYIGKTRAETTLKNLSDRYEKIQQLSADLRLAVDALISRIDASALEFPGWVNELDQALTDGDYHAALARYRALQLALTSENNPDQFRDLSENTRKLMELSQLVKEQHVEVADLSPPLASLFFWTSPTLSMLEVLFWAAFGVITNLLVNSAEFLRKGDFQPCERWVAYTKLVYGPILAMVLVMAMINGWFDVESYELRVWTLPLLGFLFGYASRRTARLLDKLLERFLGKVEQGIAAGPERARKNRQAMARELQQAYKPNTFGDLKEQAKKLAELHMTTEVMARRKSR